MRALPEKIVSGGQTGADRAALDWAIANGIAHGGWCPRGRRAEDGRIAERYALRETPSREYDQRTRWNVRDSDGTLIVSRAPQLTGGSAYTARCAERLGKPWLHVHPGAQSTSAVREFLQRHRIRTLNVAGPRASGDPEIYSYALTVLGQIERRKNRDRPHFFAERKNGVCPYFFSSASARSKTSSGQ